ncbi:adhesion G -coupled receptor L2-like isoform X2 [Paramuricea clavata]|uniref:Adhesion G -coupled receptor L2-like isoform X2 n=1 Tax=Paramuricea clavata TaxID=317549 RepID=A0A7D9LHJ7_PARCT|nr:adhesion G -coupled receptor L2-like isoform X2 [Paramuricea clavata]
MLCCSYLRYGVRSTIILLPLLGLTWAFGLICVNDGLVVFQYLFTIFNSLQGLFIFLFHCVFNTEVRKAFWRKVDIWFTNHNLPYGNNAHSRSKSNNDLSSICTPDKDKKTPPRNGPSMYSFDELTERQRRKFSTATASTCIDPWPHKLSLTPSMDGPHPARFTPSLSSDDIKYQPICKQNAGQKRISPKNLGTKVGDLNGNTHNLDGDSDLQKDGASSVQNNETGSNLAKTGQSVLKEKQPNTNSQQQIVQISSKNIETPKSSEESYIQKQPNTQKPRPTRKSSHESLGDERNVVGIGGHVMNSGDSAGHVRITDVDNSTGSFGTKL